MKNISLIVISSILLFSCGTRENKLKHHYAADIVSSKSYAYVENPNVVTIDNREAEVLPYEQANEKFKVIKYIPLISKEPLGEIERVIIYDDKIFILDAFKSEKIFIFNMSGEIIKVISGKGGGPKEYHALFDIGIARKANMLVINDRLYPRMLYYTLEGEFIKKVRGVTNLYFEILDDKVLNELTYGQSYDYNVNYHLVQSIEDSVVRKGFPINPINLHGVASKSFQYNYKEELLFCPPSSDTIYQILNDSLYTIKYIMKQKKSIWQKSEEELTNDQYTDFIINAGYTHLRKPFLETENSVCYNIPTRGRENRIWLTDYWYEKNSNTHFTIEEDKKGTSPIYNIFPRPLTIYGKNYYFGIIDSYQLEGYKSLIEQTKKISFFKNEELEQIIMSNNPDLEGIGVLYELK